MKEQLRGNSITHEKQRLWVYECCFERNLSKIYWSNYEKGHDSLTMSFILRMVKDYVNHVLIYIHYCRAIIKHLY